MITAELNHNPYLLTTTAKFNGQTPKINCLIEKYEHQPLKKWVQRVPGIFHDEMNGYDFDLYFTGTKPDFAEVRKAFQDAGVSTEEVRLVHKNELEDADTKCAELKALLTWLREHPNRKFDYDAFWEENAELFEGVYPYIMVRGATPDETAPYISIENIDSVRDLENTVLTNTPIVFYIDEDSAKQFRADLLLLLKRSDIYRDQLFFVIHPGMNKSQVARVISDLGVTAPQVIERYDADIVMQYFRNYPVAEYIRQAIGIFEEISQRISSVLEEEKAESQVTNADIHRQIDVLEDQIAQLKAADEYMVQRDNYSNPATFEGSCQKLTEQIRKWRNRKTKVVGDTDALFAAEDYVTNLQKNMQDFFGKIETISIEENTRIRAQFASVYENAPTEDRFEPENVSFVACPTPSFPDIKTALLELKEITYQEARTDFFGLFKKTEENAEPVPVITCYLEQWRSKALEMLLPVAAGYMDACGLVLKQEYDNLADAYHVQLAGLIEARTAEKDQVSTQLSDEERKLQEDFDWLVTFQDQLQTIERG